LDSRNRLLDREAAVKELQGQRWGPTAVPVFHIILMLLYARPYLRKQYLDITRYLISDVKINVEGVNALGPSAMMHAIDTKP
jgi:hypothetical protein